jgi:hypothetical protein
MEKLMSKTLADLGCEEHGSQPVWWLDASMFRERDFEGMFFEVTEAKGVQAKKEDRGYLDDFNMKKILREARETVADLLERENLAYFYCPICQEPLE